MLHDGRQLVEEYRRINPRRLLGRILGPCLFLWHGENGELAPIFGFHLPVELAERVELDLAQRGLDGSLILRSVVMKMRGMVTAKSVDERTTPAMPAGVSPFQFGPTTM